MLNIFHRQPSSPTHPPEQKAAPPLIALSMNGPPRWAGRDYASLMRLGVMGNAIVYRCVRLISETAATLPWLLYDGDQEVREHPLLSLLATPNPQEDGTELMVRWYAMLQCAGQAYLQAASTGDGVRELYVLRPDRVQVVTDANGWVQGYDYTLGARSMRFAREGDGFLPVLQCKLFNPLDDLYGFSPVAAAATAIEVHNAGAAWTKSLLDNAARPSGALIYNGPAGTPLSDNQFQRLKSELENAYQGAANAGRPMVLEGGLDWRSMSYTPNDMDFSEIRNAAAREIAFAFGVPPLLIGLAGDNTYTNYQEANLTFWRQTVLPLVGKTAAALTRWLKVRFGESLRLSFDADQVPALIKDRQSLWQGLNEADFLTQDEKRVAAGYTPLGAVRGAHGG